LVFGDAVPPSPKWWAPWLYTLLFATFAGLLTHGSMTYGPLLDRRGSAVAGWSIIALLWLAAIVGFVKSVAVTIRRLLRARRP
jgi:TRAP-type C4-dicarboxylate transport system permease small subunit